MRFRLPIAYICGKKSGVMYDYPLIIHSLRDIFTGFAEPLYFVIIKTR